MAIALTLVAAAKAQTTEQADDTGCKAEKAAIEREISLAQSRGQMLRRRQLAEALVALQARCQAPAAQQQSRAARIESLEQEIRQLQLELDRAQGQLRELRNEAP